MFNNFMLFTFLRNNAVNEMITARLEKLTQDSPWLTYAYAIINKKNTTDIAMFNNAPGWFNKYVENKYHLIDPVAIRIINDMGDFSWSLTSPEIVHVVEKNNIAFDETARIHIRTGHTFILHDPRGNVAALSLISGSDGYGELTRIIEDKRSWFQDFLVTTHKNTLSLYDNFNQQHPKEDIVLTRRQRDILNLASTGLTYEKIAEILGVSINTVKFHMSRVTKKLGAKNALQTIGVAIELGLIKRNK
jgi:LuxR family quorum-sensing system transcriptional regulator ExpR